MKDNSLEVKPKTNNSQTIKYLDSNGPILFDIIHDKTVEYHGTIDLCN